MEKKCLVSDYDFTYKFSNNGIECKYNTKHIKAFMEKGNIFAFATARNFKNIRNEILKYNIPYNYLSLLNGRVLMGFNNEVYYAQTIDVNLINQVLLVLKEFNLEAITLNIRDEISADNCVRIFIKIFDPLIKKQLIEIFEKTFDLKIIKNLYGIQLLSKNADKSNTVDLIKIYENVEKNQIFTIGDSLDDLEMIKRFNGYSSIFGNRECHSNSLGTFMLVGNLADKIDRGTARTRKI